MEGHPPPFVIDPPLIPKLTCYLKITIVLTKLSIPFETSPIIRDAKTLKKAPWTDNEPNGWLPCDTPKTKGSLTRVR